jgi:hypothetical protein
VGLNKKTWGISHVKLIFYFLLKYLFASASNALPCLASSLAISCTVSWIASKLSFFALTAKSSLPAVAPDSAKTLTFKFSSVDLDKTSPNNSANLAACSASSNAAF